jgi:hypothetical protein
MGSLQRSYMSGLTLVTSVKLHRMSTTFRYVSAPYAARRTCIDYSVLNIELAENIHLHNRCARFKLLRRVPAWEVHHRSTIEQIHRPDQLLVRTD